MITKIVLGFLSLGLLAFGSYQYQSNRDIKDRVRQGRVPAAVEDAKSKNQTEVTLQAPIPWYAADRGLDDALARYTTVVVQPVQQISQLNPEGKEIQTWYKAQVIDFLSQPANSECGTCSKAAAKVPLELQPVQPAEIVFEKNGGSVTVNGIKVTSFDRQFPDLQTGQKYLMFISLDPSTRVGSIKLGPSGISAIDSDGRLNAISVSGNRLHGELMSRFGTIKEITHQLKFRRFPT